MKAHWSDYEMYLKPVHLKGQAVTLTIVKVTEEETHPQRGKSVIAPVLWFRELTFGLILSPTNRQTLTALYGDRVQDCLGKPIVVKAVKERVAGKDKEPLRIQAVRPTAPSVNPSTGEISPAPAAETPPPDPPGELEGGEPPSELDAHFGTPKVTASAAEYVMLWPATEAEFVLWLKDHHLNGKETYSALGSDAKTWLRKNPGRTWADVAQIVASAFPE